MDNKYLLFSSLKIYFNNTSRCAPRDFQRPLSWFGGESGSQPLLPHHGWERDLKTNVKFKRSQNIPNIFNILKFIFFSIPVIRTK